MGGNKLDLVEGVSVLPWQWRSLGAAFSRASPTSQSLTARCSFSVRKGFETLDADADYGRIVEGHSDLGINVKSKQYAFNISATDLAYRAGQDAPTRAQSVAGAPLAGLKFTFVNEFQPDSFAAISYDLKQRKPELSLLWTGETALEQATLAVTADPLGRALRLGAALSFVGPEWRDTVHDEDRDAIVTPPDDGARHRLYLQHEARVGSLLHYTRVGAQVDLGRAINWLADFVDYELEQHIPSFLWSIPGSHSLYNLLVPAADGDQYRYYLRGWELDTTYNFDAPRPAFALAKKFDWGGRLALTYDMAPRAVGLVASYRGLGVSARLGRRGDGWTNPSLHLMVEPLAFL